MADPDKLLCHRCGYLSQPSSGEARCPRDGLHLVASAEHDKSVRDVFLGTTIAGRYPILGILGRGGMGAVYRSVQPLVDREVAVKLLLQEHGRGDDRLQRRFLREAKAVARLTHPGVVTLHDFGVEDDGTAFMILELVRGTTLAERVRHGRLDRQRFVVIALEILEALEAAHAEGLVHRDLKPENVMVLDEPSGRHTIKVLDFGLAKLAGGGTTGPQLTRTGMVFGTPQYMAPEQAMGETADARTDLYALGVVLYEGLAGRLPFEAGTPVVLLQEHVYKPVPPLPADVPDALERLVLRALAKDPADRFQSATEMAEALRTACPGVSRGTPATRSVSSIGDTVPQAAAVTPGPPAATEPTTHPSPPAVEPPADALVSDPSLLTLRDASGELRAGGSGRRLGPRRARLATWIVVVGSIAAGVVAAVALSQRSKAPPEEEPGAGPEDPAEPPAPVAAPVAAPQPTTTTLTLDSVPPGTAVMLGEELRSFPTNSGPRRRPGQLR